jgi:hypothetical protein
MNKSMRSVGVMSAVAVVLTVLYVTMGTAQARKLGSVRKEHGLVVKALDTIRERVECMPDFEGEIRRIRMVLRELEAKAVPKGELGEPIRAFEAVAYALGMSGDRFLVEKVRQGEGLTREEASGGYERLSHTIRLECTYEVLVQYLTSLRKLPIHVSVQGLEVEKAAPRGKALRARLRVCTFVRQ